MESWSDTFYLKNNPMILQFIADSHGLKTCQYAPTWPDDAAPPTTDIANDHLREGTAAVRHYLEGTQRDLDAYLAPDGTPFQRAVWDATRGIPYGEVRSYAWVARQIGNPKGVRAVAQALGANPLLLFVPCHRVVRSNGDLGGFGCGLDIKLRLLSLEGIPDAAALKLAGALL